MIRVKGSIAFATTGAALAVAIFNSCLGGAEHESVVDDREAELKGGSNVHPPDSV